MRDIALLIDKWPENSEEMISVKFDLLDRGYDVDAVWWYGRCYCVFSYEGEALLKTTWQFYKKEGLQQ